MYSRQEEKNSSIVSFSIFVFFVYCAYQIMFETGSSIIKNGLTIMFFLCVIAAERGRIKIPSGKITIYVICSLAFMIISYVLSPRISTVAYGRIKAVFIMTLIFLVFMMLSYLMNSYDGVLIGLSITMMVSTIHALFSVGFSNLIALIVSGTRIVDKYGTEFGTNYSAMIACITVLLFIYFAVEKRNYLYYFLAIPGFILCMASGSRKALISVLIGVFLVLFFLSKKQNIITLVKWLIVVGVIIFIIYQIPFFDAVTQRISTLWNSTADVSVGLSDSGRMNRITWGLSQFLHSPIWGHGFDSFAYYYGQNFGIASYAHNNYVQLLFDQGLIGFVLYYGFVFQIIKKLYNLKIRGDKYSVLMLVLCLITLVFDIGSVTYYQYLSRMIYMISSGYICFSENKVNIAYQQGE